MELNKKIIFFIINLNEKEKKQYISLTLAIVFIILSIGTYTYYSKSSMIKKQTSKVNSVRQEAKVLLEKNNIVKKQKATVDTILAKEKNFKIKRCFDDIVKNLDLAHLMTKEPEIIETDLKEGYTEIILTAHIARSNTKQLTELLSKIEQKNRIYIKKLDITKNKNNNSISFIIVIATLQAHSDMSENLE